MRLKGKTAIITGAGTGIGRAIALAFAREGASLILTGRRAGPLEAVAMECGPCAVPVSADISQADGIQSVLDEARTKFGGVHVLVNNAGVLHPGTAESLTEAQWDEMFHTNIRGVWLLSRAVLPEFRRAGGGNIVNIASSLALVGAALRAGYAPTKAAVVSLTKCMAVDHAADNIRVNAICPAFVITDLTRQAYGKLPDPEAALAERVSKHPIGRLGQPEDIAGAAVFLASDEAAWITGAAYSVDGGYTAV